MTDKSYESSMETSEEEKKSKSNRIWKILVILLLILLLFVVTAGVVIFVPMIHGESSNSGVGLSVDPFSGEYVAPTPVQGVTIPGTDSMTFPAYTTTITGVNLYNPPQNEGLYYLTFSIYLLDEYGNKLDSPLSTSGYIPPGKYLQTITLSEGLAPGEYDAILHVQPYRISDETTTNSADMRITINVI